MNKIDSYNRNLAVERYVEDIVSPLHLLEAKEMLRDLLRWQKRELSNSELEIEISRHDPGLLSDIYSEEIETRKVVPHAKAI